MVELQPSKLKVAGSIPANSPKGGKPKATSRGNQINLKTLWGREVKLGDFAATRTEKLTWSLKNHLPRQIFWTTMSSDDRFYLMEFRNRPVFKGDVGSLLRIEGLVVGGGGAQAVLMLPGIVSPAQRARQELSVQEWSDWLQRSDNPEILVGASVDGHAPLTKVFHRKLRYEISGAVQQKIWAADGFKCVYCGGTMGKVLMTVDHFTPLELGGKNDVTNYVTACKPCNKDKGSEDPDAWCARRGKDANSVRDYLKSRTL